MLLRQTILAFFCAVFCFAQTDWKTATTLPGIDLSGLTPAQKQVALSVMRSEGCNCGCNFKIAECRVVDPQCGVSRRFANTVITMAAAGKRAADIRAAIEKMATEPPPLLSDPVKISTEGDPMLGPANAKITIIEFSDFQ